MPTENPGSTSQYYAFRKYLFNEFTFIGMIVAALMFIISPTYEVRSAIKSISDKLDAIQTYQLNTMKSDIEQLRDRCDTLEARIVDLEKTAVTNQTRISALEKTR